jgi:hypothetical protein
MDVVRGKQAVSKRRAIGDVVQIDDDEGGGPYLARIVQSGCEHLVDDYMADDCPVCDDRACKEWRKLAVLDAARQPTGEHVYHVSECCMADAKALNE